MEPGAMISCIVHLSNSRSRYRVRERVVADARWTSLAMEGWHALRVGLTPIPAVRPNTQRVPPPSHARVTKRRSFDWRAFAKNVLTACHAGGVAGNQPRVEPRGTRGVTLGRRSHKNNRAPGGARGTVEKGYRKFLENAWARHE
jgi:hypothetical protein